MKTTQLTLSFYKNSAPIAVANRDPFIACCKFLDYRLFVWFYTQALPKNSVDSWVGYL